MNKKALGPLLLFIVVIQLSAFTQQWSSVGEKFNYPVDHLFVDTSTNTMYVAGDFTKSGSKSVCGIGRWNGVSWDSVPGLNTYRANSIFSYKNQILANFGPIIRWDGTKWDTIASFKWGGISEFLIYKGDLLAYGGFDSINGVAASYIAKWDGKTWSAFDTTKWYGADMSCAIEYQGELYVGGNMWTDNDSISKLAKWNGKKWVPVDRGIRGGIDFINCFEVYNGDLYIGGLFTTVDGNPGNSIARWNGYEWKDVNRGMADRNATLLDMQVFNNALYVCGKFTIAGGVPITGIAKWDGYRWCGLGQLCGEVPQINAMCVYNNELYTSGCEEWGNDYVSKWLTPDYTDTCSYATGIDEFGNEISVNIYPNPATNRLYITAAGFQPQLICLYDINGRKLKEMKFAEQIDIAALNAGIYFLELSSATGVVRRKFVKE